MDGNPLAGLHGGPCALLWRAAWFAAGVTAGLQVGLAAALIAYWRQLNARDGDRRRAAR